MRLRRLTPFLAAVAVACTSGDTASDASRTRTASVDTMPQGAKVPWFDGAAPLLLAPAHSNDRALVIAADSLAEDLEEGSLADPVTLVRLDGSTSSARVSLSSGSEGCVDGALLPAPATAWRIGFVGGAPVGLRVDSLRSIARQDSLALAAVVFRLASAIPNWSGGRFAGLPFSLVDLWRFRTQDGAMVVVATTKRQINQEDSPLEERSLVIAEGGSTATLTLVHSSRAAGPEETVEGTELLAAVSFPGRSEVELIFAHDFGGEAAYSIVERAGRENFKQRWASRHFSC